ncbi:MAG: tetratricopeptide repeat protein [Turicibacter sp.]|nr:tetratricopeptide repeat protein [Turicibacter sp.]
MIEKYIKLYEQGEINEGVVEEMRHFAFEAKDDDIFTIAQIFASLGLAGQAIELAEPLHETYPNEAELKNFLADLYLDLAEDNKALELLAEGNQDDAKSLLLQADMYITQGLFEVAEQKLKRAMELEPDNVLLQLAYAEYFYHIGAFDDALPLYLDVQDASLDTEIDIYSRLATCYSRIGKFEKSLGYFAKSEELHGEPSTDQLFNKAFIAHSLNDFPLAKQALLKIKGLDPSYDTIYPLLGSIYLAEGEHERAIAAITEGIRFNEFNPELYRIKARCLEAAHDIEAARDAYYEVLNLDPEDLDAALCSNRICLAMEDYEEVIANAAHYEEGGLVDDRFFWDLALSHQELENYDEALENYEKALATYGQDPAFLKDFANFLIEDGNAKEAILRLKRIVELDPSDLGAKELLEQLSAEN